MKEKAIWNSFVTVVMGLLSHQTAENYNYVCLVDTLLENNRKMGLRMFLKVSDIYLDSSMENGAFSEEQGEHFLQDILDFERYYQGQYNENIMGHYIWGLIRESYLQYNRKSRNTTHV